MRVFMFKALALTFIAATADAIALESKTIEASPSTSSKWTMSEVDRYHPGAFTTAVPNSFAAIHADEWYGKSGDSKDQKKDDLKAPPKEDSKKNGTKKDDKNDKSKDNKNKNGEKSNGKKIEMGPESNHKNKAPPAKELNNKNKPQVKLTGQAMETKYFNEIETTVRKNKDMVFMYVQSGCHFCDAAKDLLKRQSIPFKAVDLNDRADAKDFMEALKKKAKRDTVPLVYVNQKLIGGFKELQNMSSSGTLKKATEPPKAKPGSKSEADKKKKNDDKQKIKDLKDGKLDPKIMKEGVTPEILKAASQESKDVNSVKKMIDTEIKKNAIVVFSRTDCQACIKVKDLLTKHKIVHKVIYVDKSEFDVGAISKALLEKTGSNSVPIIFGNQMYLGGYDEILDLEKNGKLDGSKNDPKYRGPTKPELVVGKGSSENKQEQQKKDQDDAKKNGKPGQKKENPKKK